jgi:hypothetical protein
VTRLLASANLFAEEMGALMIATSDLKAAGADGFNASRRAACDWLQASPERWRPWIPASCPGGAHPDASQAACVACAAGAFCPGGYAPPTACPAGFYCPNASAAPLPCPAGRTTANPGAADAGSCSLCTADAMRLVGGGCLAVADGLPAFIIPALALAAALAALAVHMALEAERKLWQMDRGELVFGEPLEVLGRGHEGIVVKVLLPCCPPALVISAI